MHMSLRACHVLVDRKPFNNYIKQRSSLVSVDMGKRLSAHQIRNATKIEEQSSDEESDANKINDKNDIDDKDRQTSFNNDPSENENSLNDRLNVVKTTFDDQQLLTNESVGVNNSALTDVSATEIDALLSITGNFGFLKLVL